MVQRYNLKKIGELLQRGFNEQELRDFCFYTDSFRHTVHEALPEGSGHKAEIIRRLLAYAAPQKLLDTVLAWAEEKNPAQFAAYREALVAQVHLAENNPYRGLAAFREVDAPLFFRDGPSANPGHAPGPGGTPRLEAAVGETVVPPRLGAARCFGAIPLH